MRYCFILPINCFETESGSELYTLSELYSKMTELSEESNVYEKIEAEASRTLTYFFANVEGRNNEIRFKNMAEYSINNSGIKKEMIPKYEKLNIIIDFFVFVFWITLSAQRKCKNICNNYLNLNYTNKFILVHVVYCLFYFQF